MYKQLNKQIMKTKLLLLTLFCSSLVLLANCKSSQSDNVASAKGNETSKNYDIKDFNKLVVSSAIDIVYTKGKSAMTAQGDADLLSHLQVKSENGQLTLKIEGVRNIKSSLKVQISSSDLSVLTMSGATSFVTKETMNADNFVLDVSGASKFTVGKIDNKNKTSLNLSGASNAEIENIYSSSIQIDESGASKLKIGQIKSQSCPINLSGASKLDITLLQVPHANIDVSGASKMESQINVDKLTISASGASSATIKGTTKRLKKDVSTASKLNIENLKITELD